MAAPPSPPMKPRRPYLLRAIHEWITDSLCTPHLVVDASVKGVEVPRQYVKDGKIVLNVSWNATANLRLGNEELTFSGRFGGTSMSLCIPIQAVLAIYARETGQGMIFTDEDAVEAPASAKEPTTGDASTSADTPGTLDEGGGGDRPPPRRPSGGGRAKLKVVK
ncbi:MAG TPA: ClpXP protease specificity-enhancing factor [Steroidobacteraceae bacterium]|nr:ClpXP protease specificity-enhancing factor [Steroidobacteraceae bacterium]